LEEIVFSKTNYLLLIRLSEPVEDVVVWLSTCKLNVNYASFGKSFSDQPK